MMVAYGANDLSAMNPQLTINLEDPEVAQHFAECAVGDQKTITFTVASKDDTSLSGTIDEVEEGYKEDAGDEPKPDAEDEGEKGTNAHGRGSPKRGGMPKALTLVISAGR